MEISLSDALNIYNKTVAINITITSTAIASCGIIGPNTVAGNPTTKQILNMLGHELIHREQYLKIEDDKLREKIFKSNLDPKTYLSKKYELMSYAWQIIEFFKLTGKTDEEIKKILQHNSMLKFSFSPVLLFYHETFKNNPDVLKRLYKYMYEYLT